MLLAGVLLVMLLVPAQAQDSLDFSSEQKTVARKNLNEKLQSNSPVTLSGSVSNLPSISLTSLFSDTQADARFSISSGESMFNIGLSQSFSQKPQSATFLDLDGITTGTTFSIAWQRTIGRRPIPAKLPISNLQKFIEVKQKVRERKKIDPAVEVTFLDMDEPDRKELIEAGAIDLDAFATPWIFTARFSASRVAFEYITDSLALRPSEATRVGKNFNLALSKFKSLDTYFSFSYSMVINYSSGSDVLDYSFPVGNMGHSYSSEVTFGTPSSTIDSRIKGEIRQLIRRNRVPVLGVNPSVTWIVKSEKLNLDIPIYFLTKREDGDFNGLQGGIKLGYTSRFNSFFGDIVKLNSEKVYFGLFVTKPFGVKN
jgi:hypothetical protein